MQSILVQDPTAPLIPGAIMVREISSLGVPGSLLPASNEERPSYLWPSADLPADNDVEFRGEVLSHTFPPGVFEYYDDGSFKVLAGCPDGTYQFLFQLYADGPSVGSPITITVYVGSTGFLTITAGLGEFGSNIAMQSAGLAITAQFGEFVSAARFAVAQVRPAKSRIYIAVPR